MGELADHARQLLFPVVRDPDTGSRMIVFTASTRTTITSINGSPVYVLLEAGEHIDLSSRVVGGDRTSAVEAADERGMRIEWEEL